VEKRTYQEIRQVFESLYSYINVDIRELLFVSFSKGTQNPFSDSFRFKNPILDFLKETHPETLSPVRVSGSKFSAKIQISFI